MPHLFSGQPCGFAGASGLSHRNSADRLKRPNSRGYVYVVERMDDLIKIGWTQNPQQRLRQLESKHGFLYIWGIEPASREGEAWLHRRWAQDRVEGEWFRGTDELRVAAENGELFAVYGGLCKFSGAPGVGLLMQTRHRQHPFSESSIQHRDAGQQRGVS